VKPLFYDRQYVGYQVRFVSARGEPRGVVHVTGAASRFLPFEDARQRPDGVNDEDFDRAERAAALDAPPESGGFAGGLAATATQTSHYATARRTDSFDRDSKE
jgi:hypothetical protein